MWRDILRDLGLRVDEDLPPWLLRTISVDKNLVRTELDSRGLTWDHHTHSPRPDPDTLRLAAEDVIARSARKAGVSGAVSGAAGVFGVPSETATRLIQTLRLAQRLAVIYGHDPESDRGRLLIRKALADAYDIELPSQSSVGFKVTDLRNFVRSGLPVVHDGPLWFIRTLARKAASAVGKRITRIIPGLGAGIGAWQGQQTFLDQGDRMHAVFARAWDGHPPRTTDIEDAIEVTPAG